MRRRYERQHRYVRETFQSVVAGNVRNKKKIDAINEDLKKEMPSVQTITMSLPNHAQNFRLFEYGMEWFNKGRSLEIAPSTYLKDPLFVDGFMRAKERRRLHITLYCMGVMYTNEGIMYDQIEDNYKRDFSFVRGYVDAMNEDEDYSILYFIGVKFANDGWMYDQIPYRYRANNSFVRGYVDAMNNRVKEDGLKGRKRKRGKI